MKRARVTINDVAKQAGVSKATVSAVLNESGSVKLSTRGRVLSVIEQLNYRPSGVASRMGVRKGKCLGLLVKETDNPYYAEIIAGVRTCADKRGYTLLVTSSEGEYEAERRAMEILQAKDVDGLIITPVLDDQTDLSHLFELKRRNYPFVLLEEIRGVQANLVDVDNIEASRRAIEYLIAQGHARLVHFAGPSYSTHSLERIDGVRRAYSGSSLVFAEEVIAPAGAHLEDGYRAALAYFGERTAEARPTAVTCYNDLVALGVLRALRELGLRVPEDISLIGYDDIQLLDYLPLPLTSVHVPKFEMGKVSAEMLIRQIESEEPLPPQKVYLEATLVVRQSTRALRDDTARTDGDGRVKTLPNPAESGEQDQRRRTIT